MRALFRLAAGLVLATALGLFLGSANLQATPIPGGAQKPTAAVSPPTPPQAQPPTPTQVAGPAAGLAGTAINTQSPFFIIGVEAMSVLLFGGILAIVLEWQRRKYEKEQRRQLTTKAKLGYLRGIRREVKSIVEPLEVLLIDEETVAEMVDRGEEIPRTKPSQSLQDFQKTTYWEALVPSGLLPSVTEPETLSQIAEFYQQLRVTVSLLQDRYEQINQEQLRAASRDISVGVLAMFAEEDDRRFVRERFAPSLLDLARQGTDLVALLDEEIGQLSNSRYEQETQDTLIESGHDESDLEFEDIYLVDLNEHVSRRKPEPDANGWGRRGRSNIVDQEIDEMELGLILRLSAEPPEGWGDRIYYGEKEGYDAYDNQKYAEVKNRYVIFEGTSKELIEHLAELEEAIKEMNRRYRDLLAEKADEELRKAKIEKAVRDHILATKEIVDSSLSQNKI